MPSVVAVVKTSPDTVIADYRRVMHLADYQTTLSNTRETIIKLNLSWTKYVPACSSQPWQLEGVLKTLYDDGFPPDALSPVENKTVVTNPRQGVVNNRWHIVLKKYGLHPSTTKGKPGPEIEEIEEENHLTEAER